MEVAHNILIRYYVREPKRGTWTRSIHCWWSSAHNAKSKVLMGMVAGRQLASDEKIFLKDLAGVITSKW